MTFLEHFTSHEGNLIRLKHQLCWYDNGAIWDNTPDRTCLLLEVGDFLDRVGDVVAATASGAAATEDVILTAHLLIDGIPQWIWITEHDVELL